MSGPFGLGGELARSRQDIDGGQKSGSGKSLGRVVGDAEFCPPSMLTVYQEGEMGVLRQIDVSGLHERRGEASPNPF